MSRVPFTILTGWLGAGKTSALNRMLAAQHGRKIAVLVNELGRIAIDTQLIIGRGNDVLELAGGCVCCKVDLKNDLWDGIGDIVARSAPDSVVLETTGIAEPAAILDGLVRVPAAVRDRIQPAGVICVVDAETGAQALVTRDEAREQALAADRILLSKLDVATPDATKRCHAILDELLPGGEAERASFPHDDAGARALTAWIIERRPLRAWTERTGGEPPRPHRHGQLVAISFSDPVPLVGERVLAVVEGLGDRLVRAKGFVNLAGDDRRGFLERAGIRTELRHDGIWADGAPRRTELVLIGDDLDEGAVHRALWACRAGG
ncbi:MAG TPA: GTP-binding protein [Kofleriaceae bacterium]